MPNVFSIFIDAGPRTLPNKAIEYVLGSDDWLRLMNGRLYFLYTDLDSEKIFEKLKCVLHEEDTFFMSNLQKDDESIGYLPMNSWTWLSKYLPFDALPRDEGATVKQ